MTLEEKDRRYVWLRSQEAWHGRRVKGANWHSRQRLWYRRQANNVFTYTEMLQRTIKRCAPQIIENIRRSNALYQRIMAKGLQSTVNMV